MAAADQRYLDIGSLKIDDEIKGSVSILYVMIYLFALYVGILKWNYFKEGGWRLMLLSLWLSGRTGGG